MSPLNKLASGSPSAPVTPQSPLVPHCTSARVPASTRGRVQGLEVGQPRRAREVRQGRGGLAEQGSAAGGGATEESQLALSAKVRLEHHLVGMA